MGNVLLAEILKLPVSERLSLMEDIWDSISSEESSEPIPRSHLLELKIRRESNAQNPDRLLSLEELKDRIEKDK